MAEQDATEIADNETKCCELFAEGNDSRFHNSWCKNAPIEGPRIPLPKGDEVLP